MGAADHGWAQVCLAAIMAQVGACVPAASLELTPVDRIFVRMGARDNIVSGQVSALLAPHKLFVLWVMMSKPA